MDWKFRLDALVIFEVRIKYETDEHNGGRTDILERYVCIPEKRKKIFTENISLLNIPARDQEFAIKPSKIRGNEIIGDRFEPP